MNSSTKYKTRILVVEDDQAIGDMLSTLLEMEGYQVTVVDSANAAMSALQPTHNHYLDLVLLDLQLPDVDGADMIRQVVARGQTVPPVIVVSAKREIAVDAAAQAIGAAAVLYKPFEVRELLSGIDSVLVRQNTTNGSSQ